ncbi:protein telomere ends associated-like isoform X1 [Drosophila pseudoobscura]|uniref:Protein telomere ends associated-like isoform X1 n=1 Tax=Drosophila pseudoobscura pseudoobscura TaxID=46245 RepID=A0A6I8V4X1_DROPS|nr:protein telomere ends associated isoform X1 [Drosophila pseudoobscura]
MYSPRKKAHRPAVSFREFSKLIKNLPDIAFDVQSDQAEEGSYKTLDECAQWYYEAFYKDPSVRKRYKFQVRACAKVKKDKLLSLPEAEVDDTPEESEHESADDVVVKVDKMGMFMFPVTFEDFAKYADTDMICKLTTQKETSTEDIQPDSKQKRSQLQKFYNSFYMFPEERKSTNIFPEAPPALLVKLLRPGYPVDEGAGRSLAEHKKTGPAIQENERHREPEAPEGPEATSDFPIVSFQVFEKHLANLYDIVWQLKLNDPEYVVKDFEEGAYCYYLAFYLTPEIRDRYKYILKPCTSDLSARLLAIPSREEAEKLRRNLPELIKPSPDLERPKSPDLVTETAVAPVDFKFFKKYIVNLDDISQQMRCCDEYKDLSKEECGAEYFRQFYSSPEIRERFQYKLKPCPGMVRERLLGRPACSDRPSNGAEKAAEQNRPAPIKESSRKSDPEPLPEEEHCVENDNNNNKKFPVTFKEFKRSVTNLSEIVQKMQQSEEYREKSEEQCAKEYYQGFYSMPQMRERFDCKFKPCPAKKCNLLLRYAVEHPEPSEEQSENIPPKKTTKPSSLSSARDDVVTIGSARFKFPVSLGVFRRSINYDEIVRSRLGKSTVKPQLQAQTANPKNPQYERYFRQFYVGFYAFPNFRKQHAYRFKCGGDKQLLKKLCDYAVPLNESAKRKVEDEQKRRRPIGSRGRAEAEPTLKPKPDLTDRCGVTKPISFKVFSKLLYLEDAVSKMQLHPNFAAMTEAECQRLYYESFYSTPSIRDKYPCRIKPCPAGMRANLLHIPAKPGNLSDLRYPQRNVSGQRQSTPDVDRLYAARKAELDGKQKLNVVNYMPHNLSSYIARRVACPERRAVVEKYIVETIRDLNEAAASSVSGLDTVRRGIGEEEKTEATPVAATLGVGTTAATGREPAECPAASIEVEGEVESPEENRVRGYTVPESTTASVPASTANRPSSTTLPEVEKTTNPGTTTSVTASNEVQATASEQAATASSTAETMHSEASAVTLRHLIEQLEQTVDIFAAPSDQEHTIKHLIFQSTGLKRTIWRILFQLSQEEFRTYTKIHKGEAFYENEGLLQRCHQQVVDQGYWPLNLYVKLPMLRQLLHSKGVELQSLDLLQLSPKILHWSDLMLLTDFDEIVEQHYADRTGKQIDDAKLLFQEREQFYASCWTHDQWIRQVPKITNEALNEPIFGDASAVAGVVLKLLCGVEESQASAITIESDNARPTPSEVSICPHTELNAQSTNFVDMDEVGPASQMPDTENDPLRESMQVPVKQEAIKFLDKLRGSCVNSQDFLWESIDSNEQIINLDDSQESLSGLACFAICKATEIAPSNVNALPQFPETENPKISTESEIIESQPEAEPQLNVMQKEALVPPLNEPIKRKDKTSSSNEVGKKPRLMNEKVPQLRHEFRALPLHAVVCLESTAFAPGLEDEQPTTSLQVASAKEKEPTITASQDFALGNTLLASSQLDALLDAPNVTLRKVNENAITVTGSDKICDQGPPPVLQICSIFRDVERYRFFRALTTEQIIKHRIDGYIVGSSYHDALIKINGKLCNVRGALMETLFPHVSARLRSDLKDILCDLGEYIYNSRWHAYNDSLQDLRARVLSMFMDVAPKFAFFRAEFDNATREWATCSTIDWWDPGVVGPRPRGDVGTVLKPGVLGRMKELKAQLR